MKNSLERAICGELIHSKLGKGSAIAQFAALDTKGLRHLITRLARSSNDLRQRAAQRAGMLDTPPGEPRSDPIYQRLYFALEGLIRQIRSAQDELSRRTGVRIHGGSRRTKLRIHPEAPTEPSVVARDDTSLLRPGQDDLAPQ